MTGGGASERLAPVTPLFGSPDPAASSGAEDAPHAATVPDWHPTWSDDRVTRVGGPGADDADAGDADGGDLTRAAYDRLLRRLRRRGMSVSEALTSLRGDGLDTSAAHEIVAELQDRRWLDDAALAEQLVHAARTRKGEGRRAIAQTLAKRGIARDIADVALTALPDDDHERAREFAVQKARGMRHLDRDAALRRLVGQLQRRGYPGGVAFAAAAEALDDEGDTGAH